MESVERVRAYNHPKTISTQWHCFDVKVQLRKQLVGNATVAGNMWRRSAQTGKKKAGKGKINKLKTR